MEKTAIARRVRRKLIAAVVTVGGFVAATASAASAADAIWHGTTWL